jgi:glucoamylase
MKLATVLHSLGLTGSVFDLSMTIITIDTYIKKETPIAKSRLLANIGPDGVNSHRALVSTVVFVTDHAPWHVLLVHVTPLPTGGLSDRQPKHSKPRLCVFLDPRLCSRIQTSHRGLCFRRDPSLRRLIDAYTSVEAIIQQILNPSGPAGKSGLGEPKFNVQH